MIEEIPVGEAALGWRLSGKISSEDYAAVRRRLEEATGGGDQRLALLVIVSDDARWGLDALLADATLAPYTFRIGRLALVGASWTSTLAFAADLWPGWSVRHFSPDGEAAAKRWIAGGAG